MIRVAIIDDHLMVRKGVEYVLGAYGGEFRFAGERGGGEDAAAWVASIRPDVLLLDIRMPDKNGIDALREILAARPEQKVVMLTTSDADNDIYESLRLGAKGYILKGRDSDRLADAVRTVAAGGVFVPGRTRALYDYREKTGGLTKRETEVLELLAKGFSAGEIGERLDVTMDTVKSYMKNIYVKLDVNERVTAITEAYRRGFLRRER